MFMKIALIIWTSFQSPSFSREKTVVKTKVWGVQREKYSKQMHVLQQFETIYKYELDLNFAIWICKSLPRMLYT